MAEGWKPLVIFTDQSESFANGVEAGMLYQRFNTETDTIEACSHIANREILTSMAEFLDWDICIEESESEGWDYLIATKKQIKPKPKFTVI